LYAAFSKLPVALQPVPYADHAVDEVREQLVGLNGALMWVTPIQDGANRAVLDPLLREVAAAGVWVSAHPDVILHVGTKEVLYRTRELGWGRDIMLYRSWQEFARGSPVASHGWAAWSSSRAAATAATESGKSSCRAASQGRPVPMPSSGPASSASMPAPCL
jgi:hypothetical protein